VQVQARAQSVRARAQQVRVRVHCRRIQGQSRRQGGDVLLLAPAPLLARPGTLPSTALRALARLVLAQELVQELLVPAHVQVQAQAQARVQAPALAQEQAQAQAQAQALVMARPRLAATTWVWQRQRLPLHGRGGRHASQWARGVEATAPPARRELRA